MKLLCIVLLCVLCIGITPALGDSFAFTAVNIGQISVVGDHVPWATLHGAAVAGAVIDDNHMYARVLTDNYAPNTWSAFERGFMVFDTTSIPIGEYPYEVNLTFTVQITQDSFGGNVDIVDFHPTANTTHHPGVADYNEFSDVAIVSLDISDYTSGSHEISIDPLLIHPGSLTWIGFRIEYDTDDYPPSWLDDKAESFGISWSTKPIIQVYTSETPYGPTAIITASPTSGNVPLDVTFTDASTGFSESYPYPTYIIDYGDGDTDSGERQYTGENWFHQYDYARTYTVNYTVTQSSIVHTDSETITVGGALTNFYVQVGGRDTAPISGANVTVWYNGALQDWYGTNANGRSYFDVPSGRLVNGTVSKTGYQTASYSQYVSTWDTYVTVGLLQDNETPINTEGYWNYILDFSDAVTHGGISPVYLTLYADSGHTDVYTQEYVIGGTWTGLIPNGTMFYFSADAGDYYLKSNWSHSLNGASESQSIKMVPTSYGFYPKINIYVKDVNGGAISDANVEAEPNCGNSYHTTNEIGYTYHYGCLLGQGSSATYTVTASKGGYVDETGVIDVTTRNPTITLYLERYATPTPTGVYTPIATPTWSGPGGTPGNIKEAIINFFVVTLGLSDFEARMMIGLLITLFSAVIVGASIAGIGQGSSAGVGAMIGAVAGFVGASVMGFIPVWILVIAVLGMVAMFFVFKPGAGE